jgi:hypothetical protein
LCMWYVLSTDMEPVSQLPKMGSSPLPLCTWPHADLQHHPQQARMRPLLLPQMKGLLLLLLLHAVLVLALLAGGWCCWRRRRLQAAMLTLPDPIGMKDASNMELKQIVVHGWVHASRRR